jgi:hypothetical protein
MGPEYSDLHFHRKRLKIDPPGDGTAVRVWVSFTFHSQDRSEIGPYLSASSSTFPRAARVVRRYRGSAVRENESE